jgi:S1-C subfamily serine protease
VKAALIAAALTLPGAGATPPLEAVTVIVDSPKVGCSGVVVEVLPGKTYVMTAKHCSTLDNPEAVTFSDGTSLLVDRIVTSALYDLELLRVRTANTYPAAPIAFTQAPMTHFTFHGRSGGQDWAYAMGYISGPMQRLSYGKWRQHTIPLACMGCAEGGSGGGIFADGKLIGIFVAGREDNSMSYMIPSSAVVRFIRAAALEESK